jgi:carbon starvation protein
MTVRAMPVMLGVLAALAVAYRYYSAFLAARVASLDDSRITPAHERYDGQNYHPTNRWVLFGHHFAAISGAGPLIGPVLALQFGYLPGLAWLVVGVCLAGAVQDMMVLVASTRRGGQSLAGIAFAEIGPVAGRATALAVLYIVIIALAGLGIVVVKALGGEEARLKSGGALVYPEGAEIQRTMSRERTTFHLPPGTDYRFDPKAPAVTSTEAFEVVVPPGTRANFDREAGRTKLTVPRDARRVMKGSAWGTFTIACTIPIALLVGAYMYRFRKGKVVEASVLGAVLVLAATVAGAWVPKSSLGPWFTLTREQTIVAIAAYGFVASVLPVWLLLAPRDYLSSFLKIGTIALLVVGVIIANPTLQAPAVNHHFVGGGGPNLRGPIFPYLFICIMCGAISGFHALVSSGTTPKMVDRESDIRMIGYGAMLMEGLVGVVALIAAAALPGSMYYGINVDVERVPEFARVLAEADIDHGGGPDELSAMERDVQESLRGRTGGAVTLAVGMARIFTQALPGLRGLIGYWYHFAIMFEALFILTTIDAGTRIGRFLVQEFLGRLWKPLGNLEWLPASMLATGLVVLGWSYFIWTGSVDTIWPMFGMANQLLSVIALAVVTTVLINSGKGRFAPLTLLPMAFVATTTMTAGYSEIRGTYAGWIRSGSKLDGLARLGPWLGEGQHLKGLLNAGLTLMLMGCVVVILGSAAARWAAAGRKPAAVVAE